MSVRGAAVWAMAGQYLSFAIQFAGSVIISRYFLDPAEVGLFSIGMAAALLVAVLQDFGLSRYISALPRLDRDEIARCGSVSVLFALIIAALIAAAAWPMARFYHHPQLLPLVLILAGSYLFVPLTVVPMARMARAMQFKGLFLVNAGGAAAQCICALALAWAGYSSFALAWAAVAMAATRGAIAQGLCPSLPWPLRTDAMRPVLGFGARTSLLYLTGALGTRTPDLIVGRVLGTFAVGLFSRAVSLSDQFRMLISGAIGSVFFPAFARIRDRGEPLGPAYLRVCAGYSVVVWPGMAGLALAAGPIVRVLFGEAWAGTAPLLTMIALTEILLIALPLVSELPILMGRFNRLLAFNLADTVLSLVLLAIGCRWGVEGAAASRLAYGACWLALYWRFMHGVVGFDARALLVIYAKSGIASLAALAPVGVIFLSAAHPDGIGVLALAGGVLAGVPAWLAALALTRHPALPDLLGIAEALPGGRLLRPLLAGAR